jgi:hypothetical protein
MSTPLATYSFLPWLRQGLSTRIAGASGARATLSIELELVGEKTGGGEQVAPAGRTVALYGPGDVIGIEGRAIVRTEPLPWITNFEPNYLPFVEFYDEDFPWRYTPSAPFEGGRRLTPWIALIVLREGEFKDGRPGAGALPFVDVSDATVFAAPGDLWAWAHVHVSREITATADISDTDATSVAQALQSAITANPDEACSRLLCPRRLGPNEAYWAFLVPTFESGRLAGLGLDPADTPAAAHCAWDLTNHPDRANLEPTLYPYYHRWFFRTGASGDFEYLVRQLKPRPVDSRVGVRDVDVQRPGVNVAGILAPPTLKFSGALRAPRSSLTDAERAEAEAQDHWADPRPHAFQRTLADFINLSDSYEQATAADANGAYADGARAAETDSGGDVPAPPALALIDNDPDPVITPPLYGRWHSRTHRLLTQRDGTAAPSADNWVHELNLDPRWRAAAGSGTQVIQSEQETLMASAWAQVGALPDANRRIRGGQFAIGVSSMWHARSLVPLVVADPARALMITAPAHLRVMQEGQTVRVRAERSLTPDTLMSASMRRAMRPRARLSRKLGFTFAAPPHAAITRVDDGDIPAVPVKIAPPDVPKVDDTVVAVALSAWPGWLDAIGTALRQPPLWLMVLIALALLLLVLLGGWFGAAIAIALVASLLVLRNRAGRRARIEDVKEENRIPESIDRLPEFPSFTLMERAADGAPAPGTSTGSADSADARRFKAALRQAYEGEIEAANEARVPERKPIGLANTAKIVASTLDPRKTVVQRTLNDIGIPARLAPPDPDAFDEIMNYPVFDTPMYKPLKDMGADYLLPNLHLIPPDSITLLETHQKFIESYMVGLNHEFSRELLWREYPTDQRGSYFRQFWDVSAYYDPAATDPDALTEKLRDISQIHRWSLTSALGTHDNREEAGAPQQEELVVAIRGELLKKYPNAVVYAHKAEWQMKNGMIDLQRERTLVQLSPAEELAPPRSKVKTPLYQARASEDVYLFGFDLTAPVARGGPGDQPGDEGRAGWFFVIKERPGEARFGLDEGPGTQPPQIWSDLTWNHAAPEAAPGAHLTLTQAIQLVEPTDASQAEFTARKAQWGEDKQVRWGPTTDAAEVAYVLYQSPALVAVHATEMLPRPGAGGGP